MKLELKHLAPYLPYKLHFLVNTEEYELTAIFTLDEYPLWAHNYWNEDTLCFYPEINKKQNYQGIGFKLNEIKPILRPLSDLTKEIEHNGEKFVPQKRIPQLEFEWLITSEKPYELVQKANYEHFIKLLEWHFDVFGLIEQGLAIDINKC